MAAISRSKPQSRAPTRRDLLARYRPRAFGQHSRWRFQRNRQLLYIARINGDPTPWQASTIASLVSLEWSALEAEARIGDLAAAREAREHRRLFQRLLSDYERSLTPPAKAEPSFEEYVKGRYSSGRGAGA